MEAYLMNTITINTIWLSVFIIIALSGWIVAFIKIHANDKLRREIRRLKKHIKNIHKYQEIS